jgi:hypothetical protein
VGFSACTLLSQISNKQSLEACEHLVYTQFLQILFKTESLKTIPVHFSVVFSRLYPILANLLLLLLQHPLPKNSCANRTSAFLLQFLPPKFSIAIFFNIQFLEALKDTTIFFFFFFLSPSNALHPFFHQMLLLFFIFFLFFFVFFHLSPKENKTQNCQQELSLHEFSFSNILLMSIFEVLLF